jgi:7-carboxy-7-deazaguanine synthase
MIKVNEIFFSIQGESTRVGLPTVFVRTSGCPLRCNYCDTTYAFHEGEKFSREDILEKIKSFDTNYVCITGGEPLVQKEAPALINTLLEMGKDISIETSGAQSFKDLDPRVKKVVDVKTPGSDEGDSFLLSNLDFLTSNDEVKFVITSESDFDWTKEFLKKYRIFDKCTVLISPSYRDIKYDWLAEKVLSELPKARFQVQLHKVIWPLTDRGV